LWVPDREQAWIPVGHEAMPARKATWSVLVLDGSGHDILGEEKL
jgi:hypothetical protein